MADLNNLTHTVDLASSPHAHSRVATSKSMLYVIIALLPALFAGCYFFGIMQLALVGTAVLFAVLTEYVIRKVRKKPVSIGDYSAILTGLLLGLIIPPYLPGSNPYIFVMAGLGSIFAVGIGKEVFGGLGFNIFNPALVGRAFLHISFGDYMGANSYIIDGVTSASPLALFKEMIKGDDSITLNIMDMFTGNISGSIGETSALALLIGGIFLVVVKIVNWRIPVAMILGAVIFGGLFNLFGGSNYPTPILEILSGGFLFGALFMATDWVTSPITNKGMIIYAFFISFVVIVIRMVSEMPEGMMFAILFVNSFVPLINKYTRPKYFGEGYKYE